MLRFNDKLAAAAAGHVNYIEWVYDTTGKWPGPGSQPSSAHNQIPGWGPFTGAEVNARSTAAGYVGSVTENISWTAKSADPTEVVDRCFGFLMNSVYHMASMMGQFLEVGIAMTDRTSGGPCVVVGGRSPNELAQIPATYASHPYNGQTGVAFRFSGQSEDPNPFPSLGNQYVGPPILLRTETLQTGLLSQAVITTARVVEAATGTSVALLLRGGALILCSLPGYERDPNIANTSGDFFVVPAAPLKPLTTYTVTVTGTVKNVPLNLTWSFTTKEPGPPAIGQ